MVNITASKAGEEEEGQVVAVMEEELYLRSKTRKRVQANDAKSTRRRAEPEEEAASAAEESLIKGLTDKPPCKPPCKPLCKKLSRDGNKDEKTAACMKCLPPQH
jgi:hypothetical protein